MLALNHAHHYLELIGLACILDHVRAMQGVKFLVHFLFANHAFPLLKPEPLFNFPASIVLQLTVINIVSYLEFKQAFLQLICNFILNVLRTVQGCLDEVTGVDYLLLSCRTWARDLAQ